MEMPGCFREVIPLRLIRVREEYTRKQSSGLPYKENNNSNNKLVMNRKYLYCSIHKLQSCLVAFLRIEAVSLIIGKYPSTTRRKTSSESTAPPETFESHGESRDEE
jgi:hypothetical protein